MTDWHLADSLVALRTEINRRWPNRDKNSDGAKGDDAHAQRVSDHNPDWSAGGVVRAIDVDKDGIDVDQLLAALTGDARVAYVIWQRRMMRSYAKTIGGKTYKAWQWAPYTEGDPHTGHLHISINHTRTAETNTAAWFKAAPPEEDKVNPTDIAAIAEAVFKKLEPRLQAYTADLKLYERQTDAPDALRAGQAAEAEILTPANIDKIATAVAAKIAAGSTPKA